MWGIVPAAGRGSRIQPLSFSKELLPVGGRMVDGTERPRAVSEYVVERMIAGGADKLCFVISPGKNDIVSYYGGSWGDASTAYVVQPQASGLCDAIFRALPLIGPDEHVLIGLPDTIWFPEDGLASLPDGELSFLVFPVERPERFDAVVADDDGRVREIQVKQPDARSNWVWGAFKMPGRVFQELHALWREPGRGDEYVGTLVNAWLARGGAARAVRAGQLYVDVGTLDGYRDAMRLLAARPLAGATHGEQKASRRASHEPRRGEPRPRRARALVLVLDGVGVGAAPDAAAYGDDGSNTLGHLLDRDPAPALPNLWAMGLGHVMARHPVAAPIASYGRMRERSAGNDSTNGHWEIAGAVVEEPFATFERFPAALVDAIESECGVRFLGNLPASGTAIIDALGPAHVRSGSPILYTSADSVLQIAAHEDVIPPERLYEICRVARRHADAWRIGRVIARPFVGSAGSFRRTAGRHDFSLPPPPNLLDTLEAAGIPTVGVGKTGDLFAGRGLAASHATGSNAEGMETTGELWDRLDEGLLLTNLVDFDMLYGHRRDADGFTRALVELDAWLGGFLPRCRPEDVLLITADHGNDPTFRGTDHTREEVPLLVHHAGGAVDLGIRETFADAAASLADHFGVAPPSAGRSFLDQCAGRAAAARAR